MNGGADRDRARARGLVRVAYADLLRARAAYEQEMLDAVQAGATFGEIARELKLSEPAVRGFVRRAQRRRSRQ